MVAIRENCETEEIGLVTPTPGIFVLQHVLKIKSIMTFCRLYKHEIDDMALVCIMRP